jgi:hypothetical protein
MASCTVALPKGASASATGRGGAGDVAVDDAEFVHGHFPLALSFSARAAGTRAARCLRRSACFCRRAELRAGLDVALGVVVVEAGLGVDAAHRADHLAGEQDVVDRDHLGQQVDARLVVDAGVEEDVVQQVVLQQRLLQLLRQPAVAAPVVGRGAAAVRDDELQRREVLEQVALEAAA